MTNDRAAQAFLDKYRETGGFPTTPAEIAERDRERAATGPFPTLQHGDPPTPPAPAAVLPPTPEEIDAEIIFFQNAELSVKEAERVRDEYKKRLVFLVDSFGTQPGKAEQSLRLAGRRNTVTVTRGTTMTVNEPAVVDFQRYLGDMGVQIFELLFNATTKHTLREGARELLKRLSLPRRTEEKVLSLFGRCIDVKSKAPAVKVEVIKAEKPTRKPRAGKQAA